MLYQYTHPFVFCVFFHLGDVDKALQESKLMSALNELTCGHDTACGSIVTLSDETVVDEEKGGDKKNTPKRIIKEFNGIRMTSDVIMKSRHPLDVFEYLRIRLVPYMVTSYDQP